MPCVLVISLVGPEINPHCKQSIWKNWLGCFWPSFFQPRVFQRQICKHSLGFTLWLIYHWQVFITVVKASTCLSCHYFFSDRVSVWLWPPLSAKRCYCNDQYLFNAFFAVIGNWYYIGTFSMEDVLDTQLVLSHIILARHKKIPLNDYILSL